MADIGEFLAPYRTAIWFDVSGQYSLDSGRLWQILQELSAELRWDSISPACPPVLSVHFGRILNHQLALSSRPGTDVVRHVGHLRPDKRTNSEHFTFRPSLKV